MATPSSAPAVPGPSLSPSPSLSPGPSPSPSPSPVQAQVPATPPPQLPTCRNNLPAAGINDHALHCASGHSCTTAQCRATAPLLSRALCRPAPARPGPACLPAVCHHTLQPLTTTTPRLQHPHTTCCRYLDSAWLRQGRDPARLSLGLGHSTVGPTVSPRSRLHSGQQPCPRPPGSRMSPPGAGQCVSLVCLYVLSLL